MSDAEIVVGLGGAFVFSDDPRRLAEWYTRHLGIRFEGSEEFGGFYRTYLASDPDNPGRQVDTTFSILRARFPTRRQAPPEEPPGMYGDQPFMVNLRVRDLDAAVARLETAGARIIARQDEPYGRFAWTRDGDGNRVELYEPADTGRDAP